MVIGLIVTNDLHMKENEGRSMKRADIIKAISVSRTTATRYHKVIEGPTDVLEAIKNKDITQLAVAADIADIKVDEERLKMINLAREGQNMTVAKDLIKKSKASAKKKKKGAGRALSSVPLGKTTNTHTLQLIIETCASAGITDIGSADIDWSDFAQVRDAWAAFMKDIHEGDNK